MLKIKPHVESIQDGKRVDNNIIDTYRLSKNDISYSQKENAYVSNFVGIVLRRNKVLVSLPKHFKLKDEFDALDYDYKKQDIRLIMDSINESKRHGKQDTNYNPDITVNSNFPLNAYFNIYNYFVQYGLYHEEHQEIKPNRGGKISWKDTLRRSNKFISKGNLIFSPLYYKKKSNNETIVTKCMVSIINYTNSRLSDFITLPDNSMLSTRGFDKTIFDETHKKHVIHKLQEILNRTFKDINKELISNIIVFLQGINNNKREVLNIKYYDFQSTWESAVQKYLNDRFVTIDDNNKMVLDANKSHEEFYKNVLYYNLIRQDWNLQPDHVAVNEGEKKVYLFDSKYYNNLDSIDYKQFMYHVIYRHMYSKFCIYNRLLLPYEGKTTDEKYVNIKTIKENDHYKKNYPFDNCNVNIQIDITRLNMIEVLKNYVSD